MGDDLASLDFGHNDPANISSIPLMTFKQRRAVMTNLRSRSTSSGVCGRIPEVTSRNLPAFVGVDSRRFRLLQRRLSMRTSEETRGALAYAEWIRMGEGRGDFFVQ